MRPFVLLLLLLLLQLVEKLIEARKKEASEEYEEERRKIEGSENYITRCILIDFKCTAKQSLIFDCSAILQMNSTSKHHTDTRTNNTTAVSSSYIYLSTGFLLL